jgi:D-lactate dehydrogenase
MWEWSNGAKLPIVCDASSCTFGITSEIVSYLTLQNLERHTQLKMIDSVGWAHDYILPRLKVLKRVGSVAVHPVCSTHHLGVAEKLHALGEALAERAVTPVYATCRAFGGGTGKLSVVDLESTLRELFSLW